MTAGRQCRCGVLFFGLALPGEDRTASLCLACAWSGPPAVPEADLKGTGAPPEKGANMKSPAAADTTAGQNKSNQDLPSMTIPTTGRKPGLRRRARPSAIPTPEDRTS